MNAYILSQSPLLAGFVGLLILAVVKPAKDGAPSPGTDALSQLITLCALGFSAVTSYWVLQPGAQFFGGAIGVTVIGKPIALGALGLAFLAVLASPEYLGKVRVRATDFRMVVLAQAIGLYHVPLAGDLATLFIAFELVSIPSYVLAGFNFRDARANEAGMKYLILGALASVLFLLGIAFLYGTTGSLSLTVIEQRIGGFVLEGATGHLLLAKAALTFLLAAILFKVAAAPFHFWLPDVYQGANLASLSLIAAPAKVALFGLAALLLWGPFAFLHETWKPVILFVALLSAVLGNFQALGHGAQRSVKRMLAYSSTVNAGFILLALFLESAGAFLLYLLAYGLTIVGTLAALAALGTRTADIEGAEGLRGLGRRHPWIAGSLTVLLFSLAGIPLTAGFAAKFAVVADAFTPGFLPAPGFIPVLIISLVLSLVSFLFYFRLVRALWMPAPAASAASTEQGAARATSGTDYAPRGTDFNAVFVTGLCAVLVVLIGILMRVPGLS
ncbi:MAG TPA: NADH-quinone oxidoreductase subunit N [Fibrobacteria bacterium]|nr:NADH-quinone oxidoreductase subunit N [Fibrobacteria bacterium]